MPTMPSLPTTLDIHFNSDTSGFCVPSALVNITYISTKGDKETIRVLLFKVVVSSSI
jgi:hypothetical protein